MSNVLKVGTTVSKNERIIDYNTVLKEKIAAMQQLSAAGADSGSTFISGLDAEVVEQLISGESDEGFDSFGESGSDDLVFDMEQFEREAQELLENARTEASNVIEQANLQAEQIREEARNQGYNEGLVQCEQEYQIKMEQLSREYESRELALREEYESMKKEIEPELVNVLLDVFEKVTHTISEDNRDIVIHLINNVLENNEESNFYTIKVNSSDYNFVVNNQGKIYCAMSKDVNLNIVADSTLADGECVIETETGVFNCGLDLEMNNLINDIKLLSCT